MIHANTTLIAGFDEVGRGCIAGAVIAALVILPEEHHAIQGLTDSKKLSAAKRETLANIIKTEALAWALGRAEPGEIDRINVLEASLLAMQRAYHALPTELRPANALIDGNRCPKLPCKTQSIIGGDLSVPAISAASILAKVYRDREMQIAERLFPGYDFATHKGYPTVSHRAALNRLGPCPLHRRSFGPVKRIVELANPDGVSPL